MFRRWMLGAGIVVAAVFGAFLWAANDHQDATKQIMAISSDKQPWVMLSANGGFSPSCDQTGETPRSEIVFAVHRHWPERGTVLERDKAHNPIAVRIHVDQPGDPGSFYFFKTMADCQHYLAAYQKRTQDQDRKKVNRGLQQIQ